MIDRMQLVEPRVTPPLDLQFRPAVLANRAFGTETAGVGIPLVIGLEREGGKRTRFETSIFPEGHPKAEANFYYVERLVKFLLWQRGGFRLTIGGSQSLGERIRSAYSDKGAHSFDSRFMAEQVFERPFSVEICEADDVPAAYEGGEVRGGHLDGSRIGFDLGASDRKVSAVVDGKVIFSEEKIWNPSAASDPGYHYREIMASLRAAAAKLGHVEALPESTSTIDPWSPPCFVALRRNGCRRSATSSCV